MVRHPKLVEWEMKLEQLLGEVDDYLEEKYKDLFQLHPVRPKKGTTSSKVQDGLFSVSASFSAGYGSKYGKGYVIDIQIVSLEKETEQKEKEIEQEVAQKIDELLPKYFPAKKLKVRKDGDVLKIVGDLKL